MGSVAKPGGQKPATKITHAAAENKKGLENAKNFPKKEIKKNPVESQRK